MKDEELMQQALEALELVTDLTNHDDAIYAAIDALRERLAQPEQEPVIDHSCKDAYELIMKWADIYAVQTGCIYSEAAQDPSKVARMADERTMLACVVAQTLSQQAQPEQEPGRNHWEDGDVFERIGAMKKQPAQQVLEHAPCQGMNCGIARTDQEHSPECQAEHAAAIAGGTFVKPAQQQEPVAWRFTGIAGLKRYMTQKHYDAQTPETKKWYEPFRCANCTTPPPAQPQQEPVAWWNPTKDSVSTDPVHRHNKDCQPLYTSPPPQRKPLTTQEIREWWASENGLEDYKMSRLHDFEQVVRAIEAKIKERNT